MGTELPVAAGYPAQYISRFTMRNPTRVVLRSIRPDDEPLMVKFHATLSKETVYLRCFHMEKLTSRVAHERLIRKYFIDYRHEMALVAEREGASQNGRDGKPSEHELLAISRLTRIPGSDDAEVAVLVNDVSQKQGLGVELLRRLIEWARDEKIARIIALILPENEGMKALARHFKFRVQTSDDPSIVTCVLDPQSSRKRGWQAPGGMDIT